MKRSWLYNFAFLVACAVVGTGAARLIAPILLGPKLAELRREREELQKLRADIERLNGETADTLRRTRMIQGGWR